LKTFTTFRGIKTLEFNETAFQSDNSDSCGLFVLYFIFERLHNFDLTFKTLLEEIFEESISINEERVAKFCESILE
jgi:hypothetical protein